MSVELTQKLTNPRVHLSLINMKLELTKAERRPYRQSARAEAAEATGHRILDAFLDAMRDEWLDDVTLERVAANAGVTVQTVIRRFGGKDGLLAAAAHRIEARVLAERHTPVGDLRRAVTNLCADYEVTGDMLVRLLAQEERFGALKGFLDFGRERHRAWVAQVAAPWLAALRPAEREATLDTLVAAFDVYVWKLVRRDMGRTRAQTERLMHRLAQGAIQQIQSKARDEGEP
jgi:AcrR family transcriptional regulator